jgi:DNA-binding IclR family transcriptional regulator
MRNARADGRGLQSVDRAVTVLEVLATRGEAGVSEVGAALGVHKSTAFRLLGALEDRGLVEQRRQWFRLIPAEGRIPIRM